MDERLKEVAKKVFLILLLGIAYLIWCRLTGIYIPCMIRSRTGLLCPGCGITRMFIALSKFNFAAAFTYNPVVFVLLPVWGVVLFDFLRRYVLFGTSELRNIHKIVLWLSLTCLMLYFFIRNADNFYKFF